VTGESCGYVHVTWFVLLQVIDEVTGESCGPYKRGEVAVRGPLNMKGYYDDPASTANIIDTDGWLHTGW